MCCSLRGLWEPQVAAIDPGGSRSWGDMKPRHNSWQWCHNNEQLWFLSIHVEGIGIAIGKAPDLCLVSKELLISFTDVLTVGCHLLHNEQATLSRDSWRVTHVWSYVFMCGTSGKYFWTYVVSYRETGRHDRRSSTVAVWINNVHDELMKARSQAAAPPGLVLSANSYNVKCAYEANNSWPHIQATVAYIYTGN